jgi:hypothetical protein
MGTETRIIGVNMALFEDQVSEKTLEAFEVFVKNTPIQVTNQVILDSDGDPEAGRDIFWKMFLQTSDYAKKEWGWVQKVLDRVEVPKTVKKTEDPMMNPFLAPSGMGGGGCDCGSCGGA